MFERWRRRRANREIVDRVYAQVVERARRPELFLDGGLPDTVIGRYDALGLEALLVLDRCRADPALAALAQDFVDRFMLDIDHSLREIGIGYQGVPRRMRKLATRFYARVHELKEPLARRDGPALEEALSRRILAEDDPRRGEHARFLARSLLRSAEAYARVPAEGILRGDLGVVDSQHA